MSEAAEGPHRTRTREDPRVILRVVHPRSVSGAWSGALELAGFAVCWMEEAVLGGASGDRSAHGRDAGWRADGEVGDAWE